MNEFAVYLFYVLLVFYIIAVITVVKYQTVFNGKDSHKDLSFYILQAIEIIIAPAIICSIVWSGSNTYNKIKDDVDDIIDETIDKNDYEER
jgi:uncharacterized membrane protein (DUF485 family)